MHLGFPGLRLNRALPPAEAYEIDARGGRPMGPPEAWIVLPLLAAWAATVDIPFFMLDGSDDGFYTEVANLWMNGSPPYVGAFDVKAPGFFALLALAQLMLGPTLATLKIVASAFSALATTSLYALCRRYDRLAALACALLYPLLTELCGDATYEALNALMLLAALAAVSVKDWRRRAALAGLAVGAACAVKQTAAIEALAILVMLNHDARSWGERAKACGVFVAAAAAAPMLCFLYYAAIGHTEAFLNDVVITALARPRAHADSVNFLGSLKNLILHQLPLTPLSLVAIGFIADARTPRRRFPFGAFALWLGLAVASMAIQHATSRYYATPAIPPLLLVSSLGLARQRDGAPSPNRATAFALLVVATAAFAIALRGLPLRHNLSPVDEIALAAAKQAIQASGPAPTDRLYVVNSPPWLNVATGLEPPGPYFAWFHLLCDFPGAGFEKLDDVMASRPRYVVVSETAKPLRCEQALHWSLVRNALSQSYLPIGTASGPRDSLTIYERR
jgi:Glycosyltransferase family 87